jgi:hypothetical protein
VSTPGARTTTVRSALVALDLGGTLAGFENAMSGQARAAAETGTPLDVIIVNGTRSGERNGVRYVQHPPVGDGFRRLSRLTKARILASVVGQLDAYDVIFLRYPNAIDLDPLRFIRTSHSRVVTVHHAKEVKETLAASRSPGMVARAALEYVQGRRVVRNVAGIVGVTDEIRDYQLARAGGTVPGRTVANGTDVHAIPAGGFVPYDGRVLRLALMSSSHAVWHGNDRLMAALESYRGSRPIVVDMIGSGSGAKGTEEKVGGAATIRHHGLLHGAALTDVMRHANLGISTLAFFRTGLRQAAVLKTRDYIARGLPVVLGYDDVDLPEDSPFVLRVPSDDTPLSLDDLFAFAERVSAIPDLTKTMRAFAENVLDWRVKVPLFSRFAEELVAGPRRVRA